MSLALSAKDHPDYDRVVAARWQAAQVSSISIMNCSGRLILGAYRIVNKFAFGANVPFLGL